eukprot:TRINITY_DN3329_c2_g1_i2.p1 TRINITY_DN3329_c2_g1~~TRINITY_DN3329_c2_g1_i2.p1  ORF type:complete len:551 (+),score=79.00 TRINITY_DN3329_c2_g1_i2:78-1655(+)
MDTRCEPARKYIAVLDPRHGSYRPRMGLSEGWIPARVAADYDPERHHQVKVEYRWPHFYTMRGYCVSAKDEYGELYTESFKAEATTRIPDASEVQYAIPGLQMLRPGWRPELAIIAFRWGGLNEVVGCSQWGETGSSVSELFFESFIDMSVIPKLGYNYEVWTVYIEGKSDLQKIADTAHLVFGEHHPIRRAKQVCGMYFLYPTGFEENCVPNLQTGEDSGAALVDQKTLFRTMQAMERCGIPTRFPHQSGLYELLASKRWTYYLATVPQFRVPPTVSVPRMLIEQDSANAAEWGLNALEGVKKLQAMMRSEQVLAGGRIETGVAKLSFSWEALDVKMWKNGKQGLTDALYALTQVIEISKELTAQPHDCEGIIVQEYIPHDLELRIYIVDGKPEGLIFTKFCRVKANNEFGDFEQLFSQEEAAKQWMEGDQEALQDALTQCYAVSQLWLEWLKPQVCEMPPAIRFDYFVGRSSPGKAYVWTLEICELGFSMLGHKNLPRKVFDAMLRSCVSSSPRASAASNGYP